MNDYLKDAREYIAYADAQEDSHAAQMALAAAAIAQAEATEKIAALLDSVIEQVGSAKAINVYETYAAWKDTTG